MIQLTEDLKFSEGKNRSCYLHPNDSKSCIKVLHPYSHPKTQQRETRYFNLLKKKKVSWNMVCPLQYITPTNLGEGAVFEIYRDFDGELSFTLRHYLLLNEDKTNQFIIREIERMKLYLLEQNIIFRDLNPLNILLQKVTEKNWRIVIVDGIGHNDFLPVNSYIKFLGRRKIRRTWNRKRKYWFKEFEHIYKFILPYT